MHAPGTDRIRKQDAISLMGPRAQRDLAAGAGPAAGRNEHLKRYIERAHQVVKPQGKMVITSCNFSAEELQLLVEEGGLWRCVGGLRYPTLTFGGREGSRVATLAFVRI